MFFFKTEHVLIWIIFNLNNVIFEQLLDLNIFKIQTIWKLFLNNFCLNIFSIWTLSNQIENRKRKKVNGKKETEKKKEKIEGKTA
jgi:hypothetical protein